MKKFTITITGLAPDSVPDDWIHESANAAFVQVREPEVQNPDDAMNAIEWESGNVNYETVIDAEDTQCTICACRATGFKFDHPVCDYHHTHGEDDPPCPVCHIPYGEHADDIATLRVAFEVTAQYGDALIASTLDPSLEQDYDDVWSNVSDHFGYDFMQKVWPYITTPFATEDTLLPEYRATHVRADFRGPLLPLVRGFASWPDEAIVAYVKRTASEIAEVPK